MQTRCPHCQTTFRVSETQLGAAKGKVRCGKCQQVFNAKEHVHQSHKADTTPVKKSSKTPPPPQVDWLQQDEKDDSYEHIELGDIGTTLKPSPGTESAESQALDIDTVENETTIESELLDSETDNDDLASGSETGATKNHTALKNSYLPGNLDESIQNIEKDYRLPGITPAYEDDSYLNAREEQGLSSLHNEIERQLQNPLEEENHTNDADAYDSVLNYMEDVADVKEPPAKTTTVEKIELNTIPEVASNAVNWDDTVHHDPEVPAALRSSMQALEKSKPRSKLTVVLMSLALLVLIAGLGLQTIIFRSYDIATKWPQTRDSLTSICEYLPCVYSGRREPRKIQLVSRDVRVHPAAKHALLISATLVNQAGYAQPYPRLAIKLSDLSGEIVAEREFVPQDYLKTTESRLKLLRPDIPTLITLEVLDPGSEAVNFEFRFL